MKHVLLFNFVVHCAYFKRMLHLQHFTQSFERKFNNLEDFSIAFWKSNFWHHHGLVGSVHRKWTRVHICSVDGSVNRQVTWVILYGWRTIALTYTRSCLIFPGTEMIRRGRLAVWRAGANYHGRSREVTDCARSCYAPSFSHKSRSSTARRSLLTHSLCLFCDCERCLSVGICCQQLYHRHSPSDSWPRQALPCSRTCTYRTVRPGFSTLAASTIAPTLSST